MGTNFEDVALVYDTDKTGNLRILSCKGHYEDRKMYNEERSGANAYGCTRIF